MTRPSVTATTTLSDKLALVTHHHLLTWVPVKLDFDEWNYGSWEYMFDQLCESYEVSKFIHGDSSRTSTDPPPPFTPEELKVDKIILSWIFTTLSNGLQKRLVIARPKTAKEACSFLSDLVKDHKKSCTSALKTELRTMKLGDLSMEAYFQKVESLLTTLTSLNSPISDDDVVHYVIDGLPEMYNKVCGYMHYQDTFPDFKTVRSLLTAEEMRLKSKSLVTPVDSTSSSPMVLLADSVNVAILVMHESVTNRDSNNTPKRSTPVAYTANTNSAPLYYSAQQVSPYVLAQPTQTLHDPTTGAWNMDTGASSHLNNSVTSLTTIFNSSMYPSVLVGDGHSIPVTDSGHSIFPTTSKSLHLHKVLITSHIVKKLIYVRQFICDNNCTIEFESFGFSVKDFLTRRVLLRYDSTGVLYPVTAPSPILHAFLVSQHTWHQRLGHPGSKVLRRLVSSNLISCNKEKPLVLCHACQLGQHVRLPFVSSNTVVNSCFDIIHSDV
ncbi:ribonuclease H-like domain-containing protein [Tanacetum coccineum]